MNQNKSAYVNVAKKDYLLKFEIVIVPQFPSSLNYMESRLTENLVITFQFW